MERAIVRPLRAEDLDEADRIFRLAFGTFLGLPDPIRFAGDADYVRWRFRALPDAAFAAEVDGTLAGSILAVRRGSVAFFGPLTVRPDLWEAGIGQRLVRATVDVFDRWGVRQAGLFTFAQSAKHVALYQKFGFWPGSLLAITSRDVAGITPSDGGTPPRTLSSLAPAERRAALDACRAVAEAIFPGLDPTVESEATLALGLGDVVLLHEGDEVVGFAVCHCGAGSEAGSGACFARFAAVRPGAGAAARFDRLLDACAALARERGLTHLVAGVSLACRGAYRRLLERGFRTRLQGVAMYRPDGDAYHVAEAFVLDDWR